MYLEWVFFSDTQCHETGSGLTTCYSLTLVPITEFPTPELPFLPELTVVKNERTNTNVAFLRTDVSVI